MVTYLAQRIMYGKLNYTAVVTKYPQYKADIDAILIVEEKQYLIV